MDKPFTNDELRKRIVLCEAILTRVVNPAVIEQQAREIATYQELISLRKAA